MIYIDVETRSKKWQQFKNSQKLVTKICQNLIPLTDLKKIIKQDCELELSISLVSNIQIKKINLQFRQKNKATNVLSFPTIDENSIRQIGLVKAVGKPRHLFLGDIVIAYETLKKESLAQKKSFEHHLTHLLLHSILHLIGFDHQDETMAKKMESKEIAILKTLKIKNPYQLTD